MKIPENTAVWFFNSRVSSIAFVLLFVSFIHRFGAAYSDPQREWEETMSKGRALFKAVAQVAGGL